MDFFTQSAELFHKGGPVMYFLLLCSLFVVAIAAERFLYFRHAGLDMQAFRSQLQPLLEKKCADEAAQLCEQTSAAAGQVMAEGLRAYQRGGNVENALESAAALVAARLREHLNYLSAIVTMAPLMGLLGTVIGMINSFSVFNVQAGQPLAITGGVGEALVATATGLCIAIIALIAHTYFSQRLDGLVTDIEQGSALVINYLLPPAVKGRKTHEIA